MSVSRAAKDTQDAADEKKKKIIKIPNRFCVRTARNSALIDDEKISFTQKRVYDVIVVFAPCRECGFF